MAARPSDNIDFEKLNEEQQRGYRLAVEKRKSVFITGEAGTGKSTLVKFIIDGLTEQGNLVALTAYNGIAAVNVGGTTLCKWAGFGPFDEPVQNYIKRKKVSPNWKTTNVLIIDEISVVSAEMFDKIELLARVFRNNREPFGGMQIIVMGDFFQLPPVAPAGKKIEYCFNSEAWRNHINDYVVLTQVIRQKDAEFVGMLREVRMGKPSPRTCGVLNTRIVSSVDAIPTRNGVLPTIVYSHKASVEAENARHMADIMGYSQTYKASQWNDGSLDGKQEMAFLAKNCQASEILTFKVGSQVMLVANLDIGAGLVNGSRGVITKLKKSSIKVKFDNDQKRKIERHTWKKEIRDKKGKDPIVIATYVQIPLILAWAITAHKSQGLTISFAAVDTSRSFACGQTYVCLSRATSLDGLYLLHRFEPEHAKTDDEVKDFYRNIIGSEDEDMTKSFIDLVSSSSSDEEEDPPPSPHKTHSEYFDGTVARNNVNIPRCFDTHKTCPQCSYVFCLECLDNIDGYCQELEVCYNCLHSLIEPAPKRQRK
ncbi:MAG: DEAD/DEAH box helicase [Exiguobacterium sp.]